MVLGSKTIKKLGFFLSCLALAGLFSCAFSGEALAKSKKHRRSRPAASRLVRPVPLYADLIVEAETGRILHETNSDQKRYPASLTKMMTLYLAFQAIENGKIRLDSTLSVSSNAARQAPSKLGLRAGQSLRVYDAIMGVVTKSANDAAVALAEGLAGSQSRFVLLMNAQARALGMERTVFQNPSGLPDPNQFTTARDMATLALALATHYPGFYPYFSRSSFVYKGQVHANHNHLMEHYAGMDGIKTGYIRASGFNLVASAVRDDTRLIGVVFGGRSAVSRDNQMESLLDDGFALAGRLRDGDEDSRGVYLPLPTKSAAAFTPPEPPEALPRRRTAQLPLRAPSGQNPYARAWGVQVGAFGDVISARETLLTMQRTMQPVLGPAEPSLQKVTMTDGTTVFRARFIGLDQATAQSICSTVIRKGQKCLVVSGP